MELHKKTAIQIISVDSPTRFWFRTKESERKINADIEAYMMLRLNSQIDSEFVPQLNEMVIVKFNEKFEIAKIREVDTASDTFFCSLPNGNTIRKIKRYDISPCTSQLSDDVNSTILLGSIIGLVPVKMVSRNWKIIFIVDFSILYLPSQNEYFRKQFLALQEFNYRNSSAQTKRADEWSSDSINFFRIIAQTSLVYFLPMLYENDCFFGEVTYIQEKNLTAILVNSNFAMRK